MVVADVRMPLWPLTVERYERMVDAGILGEDDRVELLNGQLSEVSPQSTGHAALVQWLAVRLIRGIDPDIASVRTQAPVRFAPLSEPEPDIAIVAPGAYGRAHPAEASLIVEVSLSSRRPDLSAKAEIYARAGVAEYWVVDMSARTIHVHTSPSESGYDSRRELGGGSLRPAVHGAPEILIEDLFTTLD